MVLFHGNEKLLNLKKRSTGILTALWFVKHDDGGN